ncbi:hypothetical protein [Enhygromyxa salina]|uniref:hypothetical protein n=1 Tax=Enhygromyxa salina TaxID=215803 RepID=UPI0015E5B651|nr:hypothetical protein [Enhygromyxa salina]
MQRRLEAGGHELLAVVAHPGYSNTNLPHVAPTMTGSTLAKVAIDLGGRVVA